MDKLTLTHKCIIGFVLLFILFAIVRSANQSPSGQQQVSHPAVSQTDEKPLEYKLATINARGFVPDDDLAISRFRFLLQDLESRTKNTKQQIADGSVKGQQILRERYGKEIGLLDLMEQARNSIPQNLKVDYAEIIAALITLTGSR